MQVAQRSREVGLGIADLVRIDTAEPQLDEQVVHQIIGSRTVAAHESERPLAEPLVTCQENVFESTGTGVRCEGTARHRCIG